MFEAVVGTVWWVVMLPIRILFWLVEVLGRLTAFAVGFGMMVVGVALWAGPSAIVGVPVFVVGLLLTLRALG